MFKITTQHIPEAIMWQQCTANTLEVGSFIAWQGNKDPISPVFKDTALLFDWLKANGWQKIGSAYSNRYTNNHLITAAPELLEALEFANGIIQDNIDHVEAKSDFESFWRTSGYYDCLLTSKEISIKAIAKAKGQQTEVQA